ncbi:MAG: hypothetical protein HY399_08225 [Elusimicrobia bacterium]|nr:hypothetical protein [Elusimicrobiota bacterium]
MNIKTGVRGWGLARWAPPTRWAPLESRWVPGTLWKVLGPRLGVGIFFVMNLYGLTFATAEEKRPEQSSQLKNITIEGVPRIQMKGDKPPYVPKLDPQAPVEEFLIAQINNANPSEKLLVTFPTYLPSKIASDVVLSPWHGHLVHPPVLHLIIKRPPRFEVAHWRLVIADDQGKVFRTIKGKGSLPDHITWDGMGDNGDPLRVGRPYAYSFSVLDRVEVPTYLLGRTVKVGGFVDEGLTKMTISMDTNSLFTKGPALSPQGQAYMREAQDWLRKALKWSIQVAVYGEDEDLAQREADILKKYLEDALHIQENAISAQGRLPGKVKYIRTEISARQL